MKLCRGVRSRECRATELARLYVQTRVSGHKNWLYSCITSLSAGSVPVIFSSLDLRGAVLSLSCMGTEHTKKDNIIVVNTQSEFLLRAKAF